MKTRNLIFKLIATVLAVCFMTGVLASCGASGKAAMTLTKDGKTYTITAEELDLLMKVKKLDYCCQMLVRKSIDTPDLWARKVDDTDENSQTFDEYYTEIIQKQAKSALAEKYLFDLCGLEISEDTLATYKTNAKTAATYYGGKGAYKQYFGYTATQYYDLYMPMVERSQAVVDYLYGENGTDKVTEEEKATYFTDNYVGYQFIMLDMNNAVVRDEDGNRVVATELDDEGNETALDEYETEALSDEDKATKQLLAKTILLELENGASFESMIDLYSDEYYSVEFTDGMFVLKDETFVSVDVTEAIKDLEIGEYTTEAISVSSGAYQYIVKKVALKEGAYNDEKYADLFSEYEDDVMYEKYEAFLDSIIAEIIVDEDVASQYTMANTYLSDYADDYYSQYLSSLYGY